MPFCEQIIICVMYMYWELHLNQGGSLCIGFFFWFFFWIQFNVPFKIISLIEMNQSIGGAKREYPGKTT